MLLGAKGISKHFGPNVVLCDVSFDVLPGEDFGLIGPNGSGKTTLFECLAGLTRGDLGEVEFGGRVISPEQRKQCLFYTPDGIRPWVDQPLGWTLDFFAALHGRSKNRSSGAGGYSASR